MLHKGLNFLKCSICFRKLRTIFLGYVKFEIIKPYFVTLEIPYRFTEIDRDRAAL